jgi:hypothetical protein
VDLDGREEHVSDDAFQLPTPRYRPSPVLGRWVGRLGLALVIHTATIATPAKVA